MDFGQCFYVVKPMKRLGTNDSINLLVIYRNIVAKGLYSFNIRIGLLKLL
ncbi:Uncharacterised protein [Acinetobacter baumannii]|nr:Uncharacterised protein [Acinetobacter baumannii]